MNKLLFCTVILWALLLIPAAGYARTPNEFGKSVTFDKDDLPITIESLHGKVGLIIFFQTW